MKRLFTISRRIAFLFLPFSALLGTIFGCQQNPNATAIIDQAIAVAGGDRYLDAKFSFEFRNKRYTYMRNGGQYRYSRMFEDSLGSITDILVNNGFERWANDKLMPLPDSMATKYANALNSVIYFAMLPYGLNDGAVNKTYTGNTQIKGANYHMVKVTFNQEGGGVDHEDEFLYWVNQNTNHVDYLAYRFHVNGGGIRFREAYNPRAIAGIRFVDYNNYKAQAKDLALESLGQLFEEGSLNRVSKIELSKIKAE